MPQQQQHASKNRCCFGMFDQLHPDLQLTIWSFVADAPLEQAPHIPTSTLTHILPMVSPQVYQLIQSADTTLWYNALVRQLTRQERTLWRVALQQIGKRHYYREQQQRQKSTETTTTTKVHRRRGPGRTRNGSHHLIGTSLFLLPQLSSLVSRHCATLYSVCGTRLLYGNITRTIGSTLRFAFF